MEATGVKFTGYLQRIELEGKSDLLRLSSRSVASYRTEPLPAAPLPLKLTIFAKF